MNNVVGVVYETEGNIPNKRVKILRYSGNVDEFGNFHLKSMVGKIFTEKPENNKNCIGINKKELLN